MTVFFNSTLKAPDKICRRCEGWFLASRGYGVDTSPALKREEVKSAPDKKEKRRTPGAIRRLVQPLVKVADEEAAKSRVGMRVTSLHAATKMNDPDVIAVLVKRGDDPNARNINGWTPLHYAQHFGAEAAYEALVKCGADENIWNNDGETPKEWRRKKRGSVGYSRSYSTLDHEQSRRRTPARW